MWSYKAERQVKAPKNGQLLFLSLTVQRRENIPHYSGGTEPRYSHYDAFQRGFIHIPHVTMGQMMNNNSNNV